MPFSVEGKNLCARERDSVFSKKVIRTALLADETCA